MIFIKGEAGLICGKAIPEAEKKQTLTVPGQADEERVSEEVDC
jgi:hypothetical protein